MGEFREGRHLAAIMFVDMVGYSARMQENEPRAIAAVRALWDLVRPVLAEHGGREVDLAGDGMLMEFPGALAAVRCSLKIHELLHEKNKSLPEAGRIRTRAGVHLGDIEHKDGRIYGDGVNIAARVIALAPPGGIAMTSHIRDQLVNILDRPIEKLGVKTLKNIRSPQETWCIAGPDCTPAELAAARSNAQDEGSTRRWSFGKAVFDERTLELSIDGKPVELDRKELDVMVYLLHHAGEVVTKEEMLEAVWPGRPPAEATLDQCIARIRERLQDEQQSQLKTVHAFGYRLAVPVKVEATEAAAARRFDFKPGDHPAQRPLWSLVKHLGQGGHGEVWLARHDKTREERVYKFALDPAHLASLKREITLSRLLNDTHGGKQCFVRVLDWNLEQVPYFIECEYSKAGSLIEWAQAQGGLDRVAMQTRLDLAAQVAEALAAAHSVGVLHKDLKPGNVLVDDAGPAPRIRLADFGSGGVLDPQRLESLGITRMGFTKTILDASGTTSGTPIYLPPEVIAGQPFTSQADVYALGVMLYQLVVGDFRKTLAPGWELRVEDSLLREDIAEAAHGDAGKRLPEPAVLATRLRTLEERRRRRAAEQAAEQEAERKQREMERFQARRKWMITAMTAMGLGFAVSVGLAVYAYRAQQEADAVSGFLTGKVLSMGSPYEGRQNEITLKGLLDRAAGLVTEELGDQPKAAVKVRRALAWSYLWLGWTQASLDQIELALKDAEGIWWPVGNLARLGLLYDKAAALRNLGRMAEQRALLEEILRHVESDWLARIFAEPGSFLDVRRDLALGLQDPLAAIAELEAILAESAELEDSATWSEGIRFDIGNKYQAAGLYAKAETISRELLAQVSASKGDRHYWTSWQRLHLGQALAGQGKYDEAIALLSRAADDQDAWLGPSHHQAILTRMLLGIALGESGRFEQAEKVLTEGLRRCEGHQSCDSAADHRVSLAVVFYRHGRFDEAVDLGERALQEMRKKTGWDPEELAGTVYFLAQMQAYAGDIPGAKQTLASAPPGAEQLFETSTYLARLRLAEGLIARHEKDYSRAQASFEAAEKIYRSRYGPEHWRTREAARELAQTVSASKRAGI